MREFDRCRILYEKFLEFDPANCSTWMKVGIGTFLELQPLASHSFHFSVQFAELELLLGDAERARAIFELAVHQEVLDIPEVLWKAYIDFEIGQN